MSRSWRKACCSSGVRVIVTVICNASQSPCRDVAGGAIVVDGDPFRGIAGRGRVGQCASGRTCATYETHLAACHEARIVGVKIAGDEIAILSEIGSAIIDGKRTGLSVANRYIVGARIIAESDARAARGTVPDAHIAVAGGWGGIVEGPFAVGISASERDLCPGI